MPIYAALLRISTGDILTPNENTLLPVADITEPVPGLDPDLKWLIRSTPFAVPNYDERYYFLTYTFEVVQTPPPGAHESYGQLIKTYTTTKRPAEVIKANIDNAERQALHELCPVERQLKLLLQFVGSLDRKVAQQGLGAKETAALEELAALHVKVSQNADIAATKKAQIDANQEPDMDADFIRS